MGWKFSHLWLRCSFTFPGQSPCAWGSEFKRPRSDSHPVESEFGKLSTLPLSSSLTSRVSPASESRALLMLPGKKSAFEFHFLICLPSLQRTLPLGPYFPPASIILIHQFSCFSLWSLFSWQLLWEVYFSKCVYRANELMSTRTGALLLTDSNYFGSSKGLLHITLANPGKIRSQAPKFSPVARVEIEGRVMILGRRRAINYSRGKFFLFAFW